MDHSPQQLLDRLKVQIRRTLLKADPAQVHHLRVAIRRFRQALEMFEDRAAVRQMHRRLRKMMALAGNVRDCDITAKLIGDEKPLAGLHLRRENARRSLAPDLTRWLERNTAAKWTKTLSSLAEPLPAGPLLRKGVNRLYKRARKMNESMKRLHRLRIASKKLRYTMEIAGDPDSDRLKDVKKLQKHLGIVNDYEAALRIVAEERGGKKLSTVLKKQQRAEVQVFERHWNHAFKHRRKEWLEPYSLVPAIRPGMSAST